MEETQQVCIEMYDLQRNCFDISVKKAVTVALLSPVLMSSREVFSPITALIESIIIDLPAPVSPVIQLKFF